jgi:hypothetical protein
MISNNLWVGRVVRLTGLERQDAKTFSICTGCYAGNGKR